MKAFAALFVIGSAVGVWTWAPEELFERLRSNYQLDKKEPEWAHIPTPLAGSIPWTSDIALARARATQSGKPLVILFTAPRWSTPCRLMHEDVFAQGGFGSTCENYEWARIFVPVAPSRQSTTFAQLEEYDVWTVPTMIVIDPLSGQRSKEYSGYMAGGPAAFSRWLAQ